jgi:hypothetical protein
MRIVGTPQKQKSASAKKSTKKESLEKEFLSADELLNRVIPKIEALFDRK